MRQIKLILLSISFLLFFNSCGSIVKNIAIKKMTVENGAIPQEFGKDETILICVLKGRNSRDKYLKKNIKENYKGKYEFVLESELSSDKYKDTDLYRYLFDFRTEFITSHGYNNVTNKMQIDHVPTSIYYILDRKTKKYYESGVSSGFFS
jgi:hypothetical protein